MGTAKRKRTEVAPAVLNVPFRCFWIDDRRFCAIDDPMVIGTQSSNTGTDHQAHKENH